jgi:hypothetical protein
MPFFGRSPDVKFKACDEAPRGSGHHWLSVAAFLKQLARALILHSHARQLAHRKKRWCLPSATPALMH